MHDHRLHLWAAGQLPLLEEVQFARAEGYETAGTARFIGALSLIPKAPGDLLARQTLMRAVETLSAHVPALAFTPRLRVTADILDVLAITLACGPVPEVPDRGLMSGWATVMAAPGVTGGLPTPIQCPEGVTWHQLAIGALHEAARETKAAAPVSWLAIPIEVTAQHLLSSGALTWDLHSMHEATWTLLHDARADFHRHAERALAPRA